MQRSSPRRKNKHPLSQGEILMGQLLLSYISLSLSLSSLKELLKICYREKEKDAQNLVYHTQSLHQYVLLIDTVLLNVFLSI